MLTTPITNSAFRDHVLGLTDGYLSGFVNGIDSESKPTPLIPPLSPRFTSLTPEHYTSSLLGVTSPWTDVGSLDPVIRQVSLQVLTQEVAYAAFCGVNNVIIRAPSWGACNLPEYARAIANILSIGPYLQIHISLPMDALDETNDVEDQVSLAGRVRNIFTSQDDEDEEADESEDLDILTSWDAWDLIRSTCKYNGRLSVGTLTTLSFSYFILLSCIPLKKEFPVLPGASWKETMSLRASCYCPDIRRCTALTIPKQLPPPSIQSRWFSEPLRILNIPASTFVPNPKGYPVLSKPTQLLLTRYMGMKQAPWMILSDVGDIATPDQSQIGTGPNALQPINAPTPAEAAKAAQDSATFIDPAPHLRYLRHLQQNQPSKSAVDRFASGYQDFLQSPLQPLTDNLESITYEVFEKDPIKYDWYERAIGLALIDLSKKLERPIIVAVVGAGRGPLVTRALKASDNTGVLIVAHAVEKNPNAYVLLLHHNATNPLWNNSVSVVKSDMRTWAGPIMPWGEVGKADILVSELLGSFADNELSPECLDGVQHVLHPHHGVSIPQSYTAHLTPIATPKIHSDILTRGGGGDEKWELPYVVMLHQFDYLCRDGAGSSDHGLKEPSEPNVQQAWEFSHPIPSSILTQAQLRKGGSTSGGAGGVLGGDGANEHNARSCRLKFRCQNRGVCHGLAGYFETVLYESKETRGIVELSTNPRTMENKSKDMISWFPIFFPLKVSMSR